MSKRLLVISYWLLVTLVGFTGLFLASSTSVYAQGGYELLPKGQTIESDYFRAGNTVQIDGEIKGDAFLSGGIVTVNGPVDGDLFIAGGKVNVNGPVGNSIRVLGGDVVVNGSVGRNVLLVCGNCSVTRAATVAGSLLVTGGNLEESAGMIGKGFRFFGSRLYLNSEIANEAFVVADREFLLGPEASISGNLKYTGSSEVVREPGSTVAGTIAYQQVNRDENFPRFFGAQTALRAYDSVKPLVDLVSLAVSVLVGYVLLSLFSKWFEKGVLAIENQPYASLGWGIIVLLVAPVLVILFAITIIGIPVSILLVIAAYVVFLLARYLMAFFVGRKILLSRYGERRGWALFLGLLVFYLIGLIPIVGSLIKLILILFAVGAMVIAYRYPVIVKHPGLDLIGDELMSGEPPAKGLRGRKRRG